MKAAIHIGASKEAVQEVNKGIMAIVNSPAGDAVKVEALRVLQSAAEVKNTVVQNCVFKT